MVVTIHKSQQELQEWTTEERMQPDCDAERYDGQNMQISNIGCHEIIIKPSLEVEPTPLVQRTPQKKPKTCQVITCIHEIHHLVMCIHSWKRDIFHPAIVSSDLQLWRRSLTGKTSTTNIYVKTLLSRHTHTGPTAIPGPLKWSATKWRIKRQSTITKILQCTRLFDKKIKTNLIMYSTKKKTDGLPLLYGLTYQTSVTKTEISFRWSASSNQKLSANQRAKHSKPISHLHVPKSQHDNCTYQMHCA